MVPYLLAGGLGGWVLAVGAIEAGSSGEMFGIGGGWVAAFGAALLITGAFLIPIDRVIDPRTRSPRSPGRRELVLFVVATCAVVSAAMVLLGALVL